MPSIEWEPEFSVGIEKLDDDHRHLFLLLKQLHISPATRENALALNLILRELAWYAQTHFRDEEALMKRYGYPEVTAHRSEHDYFTGQVVQFGQQFQSRQHGVSAEVSEMLQQWLVQHILQEDTAYARFFQLRDAAEV